MLNLPGPESHTLNACRTMLQRDGIDMLKGVAKERLSDKNDLCSLVKAQSDTVSKILLKHFPLLFKVHPYTVVEPHGLGIHSGMYI